MIIVNIFVLALSILFGIAGSLINVHRLWQYDLGYYDFGIFTRAIWQVAHFKAPVIDHLIFSNKVIFADHFNPSIFLFSPLFWLTDRIEILLIAQSLLVGLSGYVIFLIGMKVLKNWLLAVSIVFSYFLFHGLQNSVYSDFHEVTAMVFFLAMAYWAIFNGKKKTFFIFLIITLGFKESLFLLGIGLSFFIYFYKKEWRRVAYATLLISVIWAYVSIKIIISHFSPGNFYYFPDMSDIKKILLGLIFPIIKIKTVLWTLISFLFLPLLAPSMWLIFITHYAHRFLSSGEQRWDLGFHYNAEIAPTLAIAAIIGLSVLQKRFPKLLLNAAGLLLIFISLFLYRFIFHGSIGLSYNPAFYAHTKNFKFLDSLVSKVPKNVRVSAQNNLTPPFFHQEVWILRENYHYMKPEYIVIDARDGQNPANYLGIKDIKALKDKIIKENKYSVYYQEGDQYIFRRK